MEKSINHISVNVPAERANTVPFQMQNRTVEGASSPQSLDSAAKRGPTKVSKTALEQYLNAANPICSG